MNKKIKDAFSNICISKKTEDSILDMTVNKNEKKNYRFRLSYICSIALIACVLSITVVYAKEIKKFFQNWGSSVKLDDGSQVKISEDNGFKEIPTSAIKVGEFEPDLKMDYEEIEKMLGFSILKLPENNTNEIYYGTGLNDDGSIGRVDLWIPNFLNQDDNKEIFALVSILNKYADAGYVLAFEEGLDPTGDKSIKYIYNSKNLNTNVVIYTNDWEIERLTATFVYDDILYKFTGIDISKEEMISMIETLK